MLLSFRLVVALARMECLLGNSIIFNFDAVYVFLFAFSAFALFHTFALDSVGFVAVETNCCSDFLSFKALRFSSSTYALRCVCVFFFLLPAIVLSTYYLLLEMYQEWNNSVRWKMMVVERRCPKTRKDKTIHKPEDREKNS